MVTLTINLWYVLYAFVAVALLGLGVVIGINVAAGAMAPRF